MEYVTCNLCQSAEAQTLYQIPDLLLGRLDVLATFVKCGHCGLIYQNPRPTLDEIEKFYPLEYDPYQGMLRARSWLQRCSIWYGIQKRCRFVIKLKKSGKLLDIGCSTGDFLLGLKHYQGWDLYGVELNQHIARIARDKYNLNVFSGVVEDARFSDATFDVITLWDVLEHLHDPIATLKEIHRILKADGVLVIRIPNEDSWYAKLFGGYWSGLDAPRHLYVFNLDTLSKLLEKTGFRILVVNGRIGNYNTIVLSIRFWLTAKRVSPHIRKGIEKILGHPVTRILAAPLFFFNSWSSNSPLITMAIRKENNTAC